MPRVGFKTENKISSGGPEFAKFKLKSGERARIAAGLEEPVMEYVHTLRKPIVENGVALMETKEKKGGGTYQQMAKEFVTRALCTGDQDVLGESGLDPAGCTMCALADADADMADAPEARYALNIFRYRTKDNTFDVQTPFSGETVVWSFTPRKFNKLVDIANEFGGLDKIDLNLGPCENETFQNFDITPAGKAMWRASDDNKKFVLTSFKENSLKDLSVACGQRKEKRWIDKDIADVKDVWASIRGTSEMSSPSSDSSLDDDLNSLLNSKDESDAVAQEVWAAPEENEAAEKAAAPKAKKQEEASLTDLLNEAGSDESGDADDDDDDFASLLKGLED